MKEGLCSHRIGHLVGEANTKLNNSNTVGQALIQASITYHEISPHLIISYM